MITDNQKLLINSLSHHGFCSANVEECLDAIRGDVEIPDDVKRESDIDKLDKYQASALIDEMKRQIHKM